MPYKPKLKYRAQYSRMDMQHAIEKVQVDKWSQREAATYYGLPRAMLGDVLAGQVGSEQHSGQQAVFTRAEEAEIEKYILWSQDIFYPMTRDILRMEIQNIARKLGEEERSNPFNNDLPSKFVLYFLKYFQYFLKYFH